MTTHTPNVSDVIDEMIHLYTLKAQLEQQIKNLKPAFFKACTQQETNRQVKHERAIISRRLTPGRWNYPSYIIDQELQLKQLKREFQDSHEPNTGREVIWSIKLMEEG